MGVWYDCVMSVYVIGVPASGKSTLARMLKQKIPQLNVFSFEAIRNGFIKSQPELDMGNRNSAARKDILPRYMVEFAEWNDKMTGNSTLVEGSFINVEQLSQLIREKDIMVCLGYGGMKLEEVAEGAINNASSKSYLFGKTKEEFMEHFYDLADNDQMNQRFCMNNNIPYFVTVGDRNAELQKVVAYIIKRLS